MGMSDSWDPLEGESAKAYEAFTAYRDLPPSERSVRAAFKVKTGRSQPNGTWNDWSAEHEWIERAKAWDLYQDKRVREATVSHRVETARQLRDLANTMVEKAFGALDNLDRELTPIEALRAAEVANRLFDQAYAFAPAPRTLPEIDGLMSALLLEYGPRALSGDRAAAELVIKATERIARQAGTDAPDKLLVGASDTLGWLLGEGSPADLSYEVRQQMLAELRSRRNAIEAENPMSREDENPE
jgi:hypothetical protein